MSASRSRSACGTGAWSAGALVRVARTFTRGVCALTLCVLLVACPSVPRRPEAPALPWPERRAALQALDEFELRGRVAVSTAEEGFNASLRWEQEGEGARLSLDGPFGAGGLEIEARAHSFTLRNSRGETLDGEAARSALERELGFGLPLGSLRYWVLGVPDPALPAEEVLNETQQLVRLVQDGWAIDFGRYERVAGLWRPVRLTVRREAARVRLVIDRWAS